MKHQCTYRLAPSNDLEITPPPPIPVKDKLGMILVGVASVGILAELAAIAYVLMGAK